MQLQCKLRPSDVSPACLNMQASRSLPPLPRTPPQAIQLRWYRHAKGRWLASLWTPQIERCALCTAVRTSAFRCQPMSTRRHPDTTTATTFSVSDPAAVVPAHQGAVSGLSVDSSNQTLISVGLDATLRAWDFRKQKLSGATAVACFAGS